MRIKGNDLRDILAKFKIRYYRGKGHVNFALHLIQFGAYFGMLAITMERYFDMTLPVWLLYTVVFVPLIFYLIGWFDEKRGIYKAENAYLTRQVNPVFAKMEKDIEEIKKIVKKDK